MEEPIGSRFGKVYVSSRAFSSSSAEANSRRVPIDPV
jgi:hypothetical protein